MQLLLLSQLRNRPSLCSRSRSDRSVNIILETIASLNEINPLTGRLIQIARDGKISDDEMKDFAYISKKLDEISLAIDSLNLWVDKTAGEQGLNLELLNAEKEKLK